MKEFKVGFLINPISGGGQGRVIARFLHEIMRSFAFNENEWLFEFTKREGMEEQIDEMVSQCSKIIAVGGDGTMSMVMKSLLKKNNSDVHAGLIPLGTGNDLARILGIYQNFVNKGLLNTIRKLITSESQQFDLWTVNKDLSFAAYYSIGVDAKTMHNFDVLRKKKKIWGNAAFINKLYLFYFGIRNRGYSIPKGTQVEIVNPLGKKEVLKLDGYKSLIIGNIGSYSGGAKPFVESDFSDGYLEVVPVRSTLHLLTVLGSGRIPFMKQLLGKRLLQCYHASSVSLQQPKGNFTQIDGEAVTSIFRTVRIIDIEHAGNVNLLSIESM